MKGLAQIVHIIKRSGQLRFYHFKVIYIGIDHCLPPSHKRWKQKQGQNYILDGPFEFSLQKTPIAENRITSKSDKLTSWVLDAINMEVISQVLNSLTSSNTKFPESPK